MARKNPKPRVASASLNDKQRRFAAEYLIDLNATQAAIRAGYSPKTAGPQAFKLLQNALIKKFISEANQKRADKLEISADRVLKEIARIAFVDLSNAFHEGGGLKSLHEMDEDTRRAIAGLEVTSLTEDGEAVGTLKKLKITDKIAALTLLCKHLGLAQDKLKLGVDPDDPLADLLKAMQGSALKPVAKTSGGK